MYSTYEEIEEMKIKFKKAEEILHKTCWDDDLARIKAYQIIQWQKDYITFLEEELKHGS